MTVYYSPKYNEIILLSIGVSGTSMSAPISLKDKLAFKKIVKHGPESIGLVRIGIL